MDDDLEATLGALERRLHALQAELGARPGASAPPPPPSYGPRPSSGPPPSSAAAADPLDQFGIELRRLASELVAAWDRVVAHERGRGAHRIVLEAQADLHALAALERALAGTPAVRTLDLRAYAGGHASLVIEVS
jgi:hypothetical protein